MYLRIFWLIVIFKGKRPSSALQGILEALFFTSKYLLQNWRCAFSICEPSQVFKSGLAYTPQISLLYVRIERTHGASYFSREIWVAMLVFHIFQHGGMSALRLCEHARSPREKTLLRRILVLKSILFWYQTKHTIQGACLPSNPWIYCFFGCSTRVVTERTNLDL